MHTPECADADIDFVFTVWFSNILNTFGSSRATTLQTLTFGRNLAVEINGEIAVPRRSIDRLFLCVCVLSGVGCVFPKIVSIYKLVASWFRVSPSVDKKGELLYAMLHTFCLSAGLDKTGADMLINLSCVQLVVVELFN